MAISKQATDIVYALATEPISNLWFSARASGLYTSRNGGKSWQSALSSLNLSETISVTDVLLSPDISNDQTVFVGTQGGILHSEDKGKTWQVNLFRKPTPTVSELAISANFAHDQTVLAATLEDGVFCSEDGGKNWTAWNIGLLDLRVLSLMISNTFAEDRLVYAGTESGLFLSENAGRSWKTIDLPFVHDPSLSLAQSSESLWLGTETQGLWCSSHSGKDWTRLELPKGSVNKIISLANQELLVLLDDVLALQKGTSWQAWQPSSEGITAVKVLDSASVLLGFETGDVQKVQLDS